MSDDDKQIKELLDKSKSTYLLLARTESSVSIMRSDDINRVGMLMVEARINDIEFEVLCQFIHSARKLAKNIRTLKKDEELSSLRSEEE